MTDFKLPLTLQFASGESLRWTQRPAVRFKVLSGRVWLTHAGDLHDHFLHAGDSCVLRREAGSLISGDGPVCVRIEAAAGAPLWLGLTRAVQAGLGRLRDRIALAGAGGIMFR